MSKRDGRKTHLSEVVFVDYLINNKSINSRLGAKGIAPENNMRNYIFKYESQNGIDFCEKLIDNNYVSDTLVNSITNGSSEIITQYLACVKYSGEARNCLDIHTSQLKELWQELRQMGDFVFDAYIKEYKIINPKKKIHYVVSNDNIERAENILVAISNTCAYIAGDIIALKTSSESIDFNDEFNKYVCENKRLDFLEEKLFPNKDEIQQYIQGVFTMGLKVNNIYNN